MTRAEGRSTRTELPDLLEQLDDLDSVIRSRLETEPDPSHVVMAARELYFLGEALAHTIQKIFIAICLERRFGIPKTDSELFAFFLGRDLIDLSEARRLRQFLELRVLSARPLGLINDEGVMELLRNREEFVALGRRAATTPETPGSSE